MNSIKKAISLLAVFSITLSTICPYAVASSASSRLIVEAPVSLPDAKAGVEYNYQFQAEGGLPPLNWRVVQGELPQGLNLTPSGKLQGLLPSLQPKPYQFVVEVTDSSTTPQQFSQEFSLTVRPAPLRIVTSPKPTEPSLRITMTATPTPAAAPGATSNPGASAVVGSSVATSTTMQTIQPAATPPSCPSPKQRVGGRLRPASLDEVFALILRDQTLTNDPQIRAELCNAGFRDMCPPNTPQNRGGEKAATIRLLQSLLSPSTPTQLFSQAQSTSIQQQSRLISEEKLRKLIDLLTNYTSNIVVRAENKAGKLVATATTNTDGEYSFCLPNNDADAAKDDDDFYVISSAADNFHSKKTIVVSGSDLHVSLPIEDRPVSLLTRAVVGYQQAGAASTAFEQNYFFDLFVSQSLPFRQKIDPDFGEPWRTWGAIRAISAPQSGNVTIGDLSTGFVTKVSELKAGDAARVFDYLGGIEYRLPWKWANNRALLPSFDRNTKQKFTISAIVSGGFVTPTNPKQDDPLTYKISDSYRARFKNEVATRDTSLFTGKELDGKDYVAFVPTDRDRFFRQYYAGIRMQTFFFNRHDIPLQRFPVQLDLQYGINEYVTGGRARGGVIRLDGYFPLPYDSLNFINLFGTAIFRPVRSQIVQTTILEKVDGKLFDAKTALLPVSQFNRDYYRVGVGIDFVSFVGKLVKSK